MLFGSLSVPNYSTDGEGSVVEFNRSMGGSPADGAHEQRNDFQLQSPDRGFETVVPTSFWSGSVFTQKPHKPAHVQASLILVQCKWNLLIRH